MARAARAGARWAAWLGLMAVAAVGHAQSSVPGSSAPRRSDTEQDVVSLVDSKKQASDDLRENTIWRCLPSSEYLMDPRDVGAPNVSVGIYILNLGQESSAGVGIGSGVFFADFLLYLRQRDRPLNRWMMGTTGSVDPMDQLAFSNAKSIQSISSFGAGTWRVSGTFFFSPDLRWFPFDRQDLEIGLEQLYTPVAYWRFVPGLTL